MLYVVTVHIMILVLLSQKRPNEGDPTGIIHRSCENIDCTLYFEYYGKCYELEPNENGVVTVEERNSVSECKTRYRIVPEV